MFKMLTMLAVFLVAALTLLGLRHHRIELTAQTAHLYDVVQQREWTLRGQRVEIAAKTNPIQLAQDLKESGLDNYASPRPAVPVGYVAPGSTGIAVRAGRHRQ